MAELHELILRHGRETAREMVPVRQRSLVDIAAEILSCESNDFSTTYAGFCLTSLPHRDPILAHGNARMADAASLLRLAGSMRVGAG